jgi:outer membrane lipoprotein-sorting protein
MMKKKLLIVLIVSFVFLIFFVSCGNKEKNTESGINYLKNLDSYSCNISMKIQNDKQTISYDGKQAYDKKYGCRLELGQDRVLIYSGNKIYVKDLQNGFKYDTDKDFDSVFKLSFIVEYIGLIYTNEEVKTFFKSIDNKEFQVIHLDIPGNNKNISNADLYISATDNVPQYLLIYDSKGKIRITVNYNNFIANPELSQELFNVQ